MFYETVQWFSTPSFSRNKKIFWLMKVLSKWNSLKMRTVFKMQIKFWNYIVSKQEKSKTNNKIQFTKATRNVASVKWDQSISLDYLLEILYCKWIAENITFHQFNQLHVSRCWNKMIQEIPCASIRLWYYIYPALVPDLFKNANQKLQWWEILQLPCFSV